MARFGLVERPHPQTARSISLLGGGAALAPRPNSEIDLSVRRQPLRALDGEVRLGRAARSRWAVAGKPCLSKKRSPILGLAWEIVAWLAACLALCGGPWFAISVPKQARPKRLIVIFSRTIPGLAIFSFVVCYLFCAVLFPPKWFAIFFARTYFD